MEMSFTVTGLKELNAVMEEISEQVGDKKVNSKILIPAVREAMQPVLQAAQASAPIDTGGLRLSLQVEARRPSRKDKRSKYVMPTDTVIAAVTTASGKKLAKMSEGGGLKQAKKRLAKLGGDPDKFTGVKSDARAIAQEFGTSHNPPQPFLRPAIESNKERVVSSLAQILARRIEIFKAKNQL